MLALDGELKSFSRVWVLAELHTALTRGMQTQYCGSVKPALLEDSEGVKVPRVQDAQASVEDDKTRILQQIEAAPGGYDEFNKVLSASILTEIAALKAFRYFDSTVSSSEVYCGASCCEWFLELFLSSRVVFETGVS